MVANGAAMEFLETPPGLQQKLRCQGLGFNVVRDCDASKHGNESLCRNTLDACLESIGKFYADPADELLEQLFPNMGTYLNEANVNMKNRVETFWGSKNYERLLRTKTQVDPDGLFVCLGCVGSEQ